MNCLLVLQLAIAVFAIHPIVVVPGFMGTELEFSVNPLHHPVNCATMKKDVYATFWVNPITLAADASCIRDTISFKCQSEALDPLGMPLCAHADAAAHVRPVHWPTMGSIRNVGETKLLKYSYFEGAEAALTERGWTSEKTLFAYGYDWRRGPAGLAQVNPAFDGTEWAGTDLQRFMRLVEHAHATGGDRVVLLGHSLGGVLTHHMLSLAPKEWVQTHVHHALYVAPAWAGCLNSNALSIVAVDFMVPRRFIKYLGVTSYPALSYVGMDAQFAPHPEAPVFVTVGETGESRGWLLSELHELVGQIRGDNDGRVYAKYQEARRTAMRQENRVDATVLVGTSRRTPSEYTMKKESNDWKVEETKWENGDGCIISEAMDMTIDSINAAGGKPLMVKKVSFNHSDVIMNKKEFERVVVPVLQSL